MLESLEPRTLLASNLPAAQIVGAPIPVTNDTSLADVTAQTNVSSPIVAADRYNPDHMIAVWVANTPGRPATDGNQTVVGGAYSTDGGQSWTRFNPTSSPLIDPSVAPPTPPALPTRYTQTINPSVAFDNNHNAYILVQQSNAGNTSGALILTKFDFAPQLTSPAQISTNIVRQYTSQPVFNPTLAVDDNPPSFTDPTTGATQTNLIDSLGNAYSGNVWIAWTSNFKNAQIISSSDGGTSFTSPTWVSNSPPPISSPAYTNLTQQVTPKITVGTNGRATVIWDQLTFDPTVTNATDTIRSTSITGGQGGGTAATPGVDELAASITQAQTSSTTVGQSVISSITVSGHGGQLIPGYSFDGSGAPIAGISVGLTLAAPANQTIGNYTITLNGPGGSVQLYLKPGDTGTAFTTTVFADSGLLSVNDPAAAAPYTGTFRPTSLLTNYINKPVDGTYTLTITSSNGANIPTLTSWAVNISSSSTIQDAIAGANNTSLPVTSYFPVPVDITDPKFLTLSNLTASLALSHPDLTQLRVTLVSPGGAFRIPLIRYEPVTTNPRVTGANLGIAANGVIGTTFDSRALISIVDAANATAPYIGDFQPQGNLSVFNGLTAAGLKGTWTLEVTDFVNSGAQTTTPQVLSWNLDFTSGMQTTGTSLVANTTVLGSATGVYARASAAAGAPGIGPGIQIAADTTLGSFSQHRGWLYVVYTNYDVSQLGSTLNPATNTDIYLAASSDGGATWFNRGIVNTDFAAKDGFSDANGGISSVVNGQPTGRPQFLPAVAVDETTGTLVVSWRDARYDAARSRTAVYVSASLDGGDNFNDQIFASPGQTSTDAITGQGVTIAPEGDNLNGLAPVATFGYGSQMGLVVSGGHILAMWPANFNHANKNFGTGVVTNELLHVNAQRLTIAGGPRVVDSTMGPIPLPGAGGQISFSVTFDRAIDPSTFNTAFVTANDSVQVYYHGTSSSDPFVKLPVTAITPFGGNTYGITFDASSLTDLVGTYSYVVQPTVKDRIRASDGGGTLVRSGNLMDQNTDATEGQQPSGNSLGDVYATPTPIGGSGFNSNPLSYLRPPFDSQTLPIIVPGPYVVGTTASGSTTGSSGADNLVLNGTNSSVQVTFDRPMDPSTLTHGSDTIANPTTNVLQVVGPAGLISGPQYLQAPPSSIGLAIPAAQTTALRSFMPVTGQLATVAGLSLTLSLNHANLADLSAVLIGPDGTTQVALFNQGDLAGANLASTVFSDAATQALSAGTAPYTGTFKVSDPAGLARLIGQAISGTWTLQVVDHVAANAGTLVSWSLAVTPSTGTALSFQAPIGTSGLAIPDAVASVTTSPFPINQYFDAIANKETFTLKDLGLLLGLSATDLSVLSGVLIGPGNTTVPLFNAGTLTGQSVSNRSFSLTTSPFVVLSQGLSGTWTLQITNPNGNNTGTLTNWALSATPQITTKAVNATTMEVDFPLQRIGGTYTIQLASTIKDAQGHQLDTNKNAGLDALRTTSSAGTNIASTTITRSASNLGLDVLAGQSATSTINVPDSFVIPGSNTVSGRTGIRVQLNITSLNDSDLSVRLVYQDGSANPPSVLLFDSKMTNGAGFSNTIFDDAVLINGFPSTPISQGSSPYFGTYNPQISLLNTFKGQSAQGTWQLVVTNNNPNGSTSTLNSWSLIFEKPATTSGLGEPVADQATASFRIFTMDPSNVQSSNTWTAVGPATAAGASGRVGGMAQDPSDPSGNTVYIGGASGGIWKTTNFLTTSGNGPTYIPLTDFGPSSAINIGGVAVVGRNNDTRQSIVVAATGEGDTATAGVGFLISQDGGSTWGLFDSTVNVDGNGNLLPYDSPLRDRRFVGMTTFRVITDPNLTPDGQAIIYAAMVGDTTNDARSGIWRSVDSGDHWQLMRAGFATDVLLDPASNTGGSGNLQVVYAAFQADDSGTNVWLSPNRGQTWNPMTGGVGNTQIVNLRNFSNVNPVNGNTPNGLHGRVVLAKPALTGNPIQDVIYQGWLYAAVSQTDGTLWGVFLTKDFGQNWTQIRIPGEPLVWNTTVPTIPSNDLSLADYNVLGNQGQYDIALAVDPTNPNVIYLGGQLSFRDSGLIRIDATRLWDAHNLTFSSDIALDGAFDYSSTGPVTVADQTSPAFGGNYLNFIRNPSDPFNAGSTLYVYNYGQFTNNGFGATWTPFDLGGTDIHRFYTMVDPVTKLPRLVVGNDQGVWSGLDDRGTYVSSVGGISQPGIDRNGNLQITQLYYGAVQPSAAGIAASKDRALLYASTQDNGGPSSVGNVLNTGNIFWNQTGVGGDSTGVAVDQQGLGTHFQYDWPCCMGTDQALNFFRVNGVGQTFGLIQQTGSLPTPDPQWLLTGGANFALNPLNSSQIIISSSTGRIFATETQGKIWFQIGDPSVFNTPGGWSRGLAYGAPDPNAPGGIGNLGDFMYVGTAAGRIYVTQTAGGAQGNNWDNISLGLDGSEVLQIVTNPNRGSHEAYAVTSSGVFWIGDSIKLAQDPTNTAFQWVRINGNLTQLVYSVFGQDYNPASDPTLRQAQFLTTIAADWRYAIPDNPAAPNGPSHPVLYIGGNSGVFRSLDKGQTWTQFPDRAVDGAPVEGGYLPNAKVSDLDLSLGNIDPTTGRPAPRPGDPDVLVVTTFGRGQFAIRLAPLVLPASLRVDPGSSGGAAPDGTPRVTSYTPTIDGQSEITGFKNTTTVSIFDVTDNVPLGTLVTDTKGNFKFTIPDGTYAPGAFGLKTLRFTAVDTAGVTGNPTLFNFILAPPNQPTLVMDVRDDSGRPGDNFTKVAAPHFDGVTSPGVSVELWYSLDGANFQEFAPAVTTISDPVTGAFVLQFPNTIDTATGKYTYQAGSYQVRAVATDLPALQVVAWGNGSTVPTSGKNLVIVGTDNSTPALLHIRMFDGSGNRTDIDETQLPSSSAAAIATLKAQLPSLLPPHVITIADKALVLGEVGALGVSLPTGPLGPSLPSETVSFTLLPPDQPTLAINANEVTVNQANNTTWIPSPHFLGFTDPNDAAHNAPVTVQLLYSTDGVTFQAFVTPVVATTDATGNFVLQFPNDPVNGVSPFPAGTYWVQAVATSTLGVSTASIPVKFTLVVPATPTLAMDPKDDTGTAGDNITYIASPHFNGVADPSIVAPAVTVSVELLYSTDGVTFKPFQPTVTTTTDATGAFVFKFPNDPVNGVSPFPAGIYWVEAVATSSLGASTASTPVKFELIVPAKPTLVMDPNDDNGTAGDNKTSIPNPHFNGVTQPGVLVELRLYDVASQTYKSFTPKVTTTSDPTTGAFVLQFPNTLDLATGKYLFQAGNYQVDALATSSLGASLPSDPVSFTLLAPTQPTLAIDPNDVTGDVATNSTKVPNPHFEGVTDPNDAAHNAPVTVELLYSTDGTTYQAFATPVVTIADATTGAFVLQFPNTLDAATGKYTFQAGTYWVQAVATNTLGVSTASNPVKFTLLPPDQSSLAIDPDDVTVSLATNSTKYPFPHFEGVTDPNDLPHNTPVTVELLYSTDGTTYQAFATPVVTTANATTGAFVLQFANFLDANNKYVFQAGTYWVEAVATSTLGVATVSNPVKFTLLPPDSPTLTLRGTDDSGVPGDNITNVASPHFDGVTDPNDVAHNLPVTAELLYSTDGVNFSSFSTPVVTTTDALTGTFTLQLPNTPDKNGVYPFKDGIYWVKVRATSELGTSTGNAVKFQLVLTPPTAPNGVVLAAADDSGIVGDNITNVRKPHFSGQATPGSSVQIYVLDPAGSGGKTLAGTTVADSSGNFSFQLPFTLYNGVATIVANQIDIAGNVSAASTPLTITVVTAPLDYSGTQSDYLGVPATFPKVASNVDLAIPAGVATGLSSPLQISGQLGTVGNVGVTINVTHNNLADLSGVLIGPDGKTQVTLFRAGDLKGVNLTGTTFSDSATQALSAGSAPYTGTFKVSDPNGLALLAGQVINGTWTLQVKDNVAGNAGTLVSWSLSVVPAAQSFQAPSSSINQPIPQGGLSSLKSPLPIAGQIGTVGSLGVTLNVIHANLANLSGVLIGPDGTTQVTLFKAGDLKGANLTNTTFSDSAGQALSAGAAPYKGVFLPFDPSKLALLAGQAINGTWTLQIKDGVVGSPGTLVSWSLSVVPAAQSFPAPGANAPIPDDTAAATVTSALPINNQVGNFLISDLGVQITLNYPNLALLSAVLVAPDNTTSIPLFNAGDLTGTNLIGTIFSTSSSARALSAGSAPYTGQFKPTGDLTKLINLPINGTWTLKITNQSSAGPGTLVSWSLTASPKAQPSQSEGALFQRNTATGQGLWFATPTQPSNVPTWFAAGQALGTASDIPMQGDFDGDGKMDLATYNPATAVWSFNNSLQGKISFPLGTPGTSIPVVGNFDGPGATEFGVLDIIATAQGVIDRWTIIGPSGSLRVVSVNGAQGDIPVPGNYDGLSSLVDELAVYRPSTGQFLVYGPNDTGGNPHVVATLGANLVPVPGRYDSATRTEAAVFDPSSGTFTFANHAPVTFQGGDIPVSADYLGIGTDQPAVFRPGSSTFVVKNGGSDQVVATFANLAGATVVPIGAPLSYRTLSSGSQVVGTPTTPGQPAPPATTPPTTTTTPPTSSVSAPTSSSTDTVTTTTERSAAPVVVAPSLTLSGAIGGNLAPSRQPWFNGKATPGATVDVILRGTSKKVATRRLGTVTADENGNFSFRLPGGFKNGTYTLIAVARAQGSSPALSSSPTTFRIATIVGKKTPKIVPHKKVTVKKAVPHAKTTVVHHVAAPSVLASSATSGSVVDMAIGSLSQSPIARKKG